MVRQRAKIALIEMDLVTSNVLSYLEPLGSPAKIDQCDSVDKKGYGHVIHVFYGHKMGLLARNDFPSRVSYRVLINISVNRKTICDFRAF